MLILCDKSWVLVFELDPRGTTWAVRLSTFSEKKVDFALPKDFLPPEAFSELASVLLLLFRYVVEGIKLFRFCKTLAKHFSPLQLRAVLYLFG